MFTFQFVGLVLLDIILIFIKINKTRCKNNQGVICQLCGRLTFQLVGLEKIRISSSEIAQEKNKRGSMVVISPPSMYSYVDSS